MYVCMYVCVCACMVCMYYRIHPAPRRNAQAPMFGFRVQGIVMSGFLFVLRVRTLTRVQGLL